MKKRDKWDSGNKEDDGLWLEKLAFFIVVVLIILLLCWLFIPMFYGKDRGMFGDMFGFANALFSGLTFAGLMITILMQREELKHQRKELAAQREEINLNREEFKKSAEAQEHLVELGKQEQTERSERERRASTMLLDRWIAVRDKKLPCGKQSRFFSANSIGPTIWGLELHEAKSKGIHETRFQFDSITMPGYSVIVEFDYTPNSMPPPHHTFILKYYDRNGYLRFQQFNVVWDHNEIRCINFGIGPPEAPFLTDRERARESETTYEEPNLDYLDWN